MRRKFVPIFDLFRYSHIFCNPVAPRYPTCQVPLFFYLFFFRRGNGLRGAAVASCKRASDKSRHHYRSLSLSAGDARLSGDLVGAGRAGRVVWRRGNYPAQGCTRPARTDADLNVAEIPLNQAAVQTPPALLLRRAQCYSDGCGSVLAGTYRRRTTALVC